MKAIQNRKKQISSSLVKNIIFCVIFLWLSGVHFIMFKVVNQPNSFSKAQKSSFMNQIILTAVNVLVLKSNSGKWQLVCLIWLVLFFPFVDYMASCRGLPRLMVLRVFVLFCSFYWGGAQYAQSAQKPHIVMIVADDLVSRVFCYYLLLITSLFDKI